MSATHAITKILKSDFQGIFWYPQNQHDSLNHFQFKKKTLIEKSSVDFFNPGIQPTYKVYFVSITHLITPHQNLESIDTSYNFQSHEIIHRYVKYLPNFLLRRLPYHLIHNRLLSPTIQNRRAVIRVSV